MLISDAKYAPTSNPNSFNTSLPANTEGKIIFSITVDVNSDHLNSYLPWQQSCPMNNDPLQIFSIWTHDCLRNMYIIVPISSLALEGKPSKNVKLQTICKLLHEDLTTFKLSLWTLLKSGCDSVIPICTSLRGLQILKLSSKV